MCHFSLRKFVDIAYRKAITFYLLSMYDWILVCHKINPGINFVREKSWIFSRNFPPILPTTKFSPFRCIICVIIQTLESNICAYAYKKAKNLMFIKIRNSYSVFGKIQLKNRRNRFRTEQLFRFRHSGIPSFCVLSLPVILAFILCIAKYCLHFMKSFLNQEIWNILTFTTKSKHIWLFQFLKWIDTFPDKIRKISLMTFSSNLLVFQPFKILHSFFHNIFIKILVVFSVLDFHH